MRNNQPKFLTKAELRAAMRELKIPKNSLDFAWIVAILETGREDWHQRLSHRDRSKS
jgi:hypothetical protein